MDVVIKRSEAALGPLSTLCGSLSAYRLKTP